MFRPLNEKARKAMLLLKESERERMAAHMVDPLRVLIGLEDEGLLWL